MVCVGSWFCSSAKNNCIKEFVFNCRLEDDWVEDVGLCAEPPKIELTSIPTVHTPIPISLPLFYQNIAQIA